MGAAGLVSVLPAAVQSGAEPYRNPVETGQVLLARFRYLADSLHDEVRSFMENYGKAFTVNFA